MLERIGLNRIEVFVTNIVKSRPPGNRDPLPDEIAACAPYLDEQLAIIKPKLVVTLGRFSMARWFPMYHPAAALHQASLRATVETDMMTIPKVLEEIRRGAAQQQEQAEPPSQMKLF
jgi:DNA polymerase